MEHQGDMRVLAKSESVLMDPHAPLETFPLQQVNTFSGSNRPFWRAP